MRIAIVTYEDSDGSFENMYFRVRSKTVEVIRRAVLQWLRRQGEQKGSPMWDEIEKNAHIEVMDTDNLEHIEL